MEKLGDQKEIHKIHRKKKLGLRLVTSRWYKNSSDKTLWCDDPNDPENYHVSIDISNKTDSQNFHWRDNRSKKVANS